jgi:hypothetical protein
MLNLDGQLHFSLGKILYDLLLETEPGLLLLVDFEKAFDSLEWNFFGKKALKHYNFGPNLQKWISIFYDDITSRIGINGHI